MSVVIVGGNDCMVRQYKDLCSKYKCSAKVFTQMKGGLKIKLDVLIFWCCSHKHNVAQNGAQCAQ